MHHVDRSSNFLIDSVELGQDDPVDGPRIGHVDSEVDERLVELGQLIDSVVADERLSNEENNIWRINVDQLGQLSHESLIALHPASCIDQYNIIAFTLCFDQSLLWNVIAQVLVEGKLSPEDHKRVLS